MKAVVGSLAGARVLCADDNGDHLDLLRIVLERQGAQVTACASATEAFDRLKVERFDVVVSDLSMPGLDGYDLAHALRKMEQDDPDREATPAVAVSGDALRPSRKRRFADFQVYLPKPFDKSRLVYVVERLREADADAVKLGSLASWEAEQATEAAAVATETAASATAAAVDATIAAIDATTAAVDATEAATAAKIAANAAERSAAEASAKAPR